MRALLRLPFVTWLSRAVPLGVASRMGEGLRGVSRKAVAAKPASIDGLAPEAIRHRFRTSSRRDVIVCGHVHRPENRELVVDGRPRRLVVIPAWDEGGGWAEWREGHWRLRETGS
jgi:UDP-2,3-diacylglucosamine pyrophosphatase LpxH